MTKIHATGGGTFEAYTALPSSGTGPGVILIQEIFGINKTMRDIADWLAGKGFVVMCPDLFWRHEPGIELSDRIDTERERAFELYANFDEDQGVEDLAATLAHLRGHAACTGKVGAVGFCLGGKLVYLLAVRHHPDCTVGYYGVGIENALKESANLRSALVLHLAEKDQFCDPAAQAKIRSALGANPLVTLHDYAGQDHAFARPGGDHHDAAAAELANLRTLDALRDHLAGSNTTAARFAELWAEHIKYEFETRDYQDTLDTMVDDAYVNHIPTLTGGVGKEQLGEFYSKRFIPQMPPDTEMVEVSRTVGEDRLVDELIFKFTHTIEMDWMLPGIPPTGKRVEVPLVVIVHFRDDKLAHEHIYWDQASVLVQLGLLDPAKLPVSGIESAHKVLDNSLPSNALIERADRWKADRKS